MQLSEVLPFWPSLTSDQKKVLKENSTLRRYAKDAVVHAGKEECEGLLIPVSGQLRAYILSDEGKEITLYRLFARDMCLFSASCILQSIRFDVFVTAQEETEVLQIPATIYKTLMQQSLSVANYTNEVMASRFSDVMWLMDQVLYKRIDSRLAAFLMEEVSLCDAQCLALTHEQIARHLGTAREVVSRMLKYFETENLVALGRGTVTLIDIPRLSVLAQDSLR